jgi:hypothetical protein
MTENFQPMRSIGKAVSCSRNLFEALSNTMNLPFDDHNVTFIYSLHQARLYTTFVGVSIPIGLDRTTRFV